MANCKFPKRDAEFHAWFSRFNTTFSKYGRKFKFTPHQMKAYRKAWSGWHKWYQTWKKAHAAEQKAWKNVISYRKAAEAKIGGYWAKLHKSPHNTGQFSWFGIPGPHKMHPKSHKPKPRPKPAPKKGFPWLRAVWNGNGKFTIWVGASSNRPAKFPAWAKGAVVQYRHKGGNWRTLHKGKQWPFVHATRNGRRGHFEYRAAYIYKNGQHGPWSKSSSRSFSKAA